MTKVWIVVDVSLYDYDGKTIEGVHISEESAKAHKQHLETERNYKSKYSYIDIEEHEVSHE